MESKWSNILFTSLWLSGLLRCILLSGADNDKDWEHIFRIRSDEEWRAIWHTEKHRRCFEQVESHLRWACSKDIYQISKRSKTKHEHSETLDDDGFLPIERAFSYGIRQRRNRRNRFKRESNKPGIYEECCHPGDGCSWEEYAEYCGNNTRSRS